MVICVCGADAMMRWAAINPGARTLPTPSKLARSCNLRKRRAVNEAPVLEIAEVP